MKATGIVRKVDKLGRIVLPIELRRTLDIMEKDSIELFLDGKLIVLRKYELSCTFCGEKKNLFPFRGKSLCQSCVRTIARETGEYSD